MNAVFLYFSPIATLFTVPYYRDSHASMELPTSWFVKASAIWRVSKLTTEGSGSGNAYPPLPLGSLGTYPRLRSPLQTKMSGPRSKCTSLQIPTLLLYNETTHFLNRPFYGCLLSDPAYEWQARLPVTLYEKRPHCFYHANCVVVMLTSLHLHKKSKEVYIKTRSPAASLPAISQVTQPQL